MLYASLPQLPTSVAPDPASTNGDTVILYTPTKYSNPSYPGRVYAAGLHGVAADPHAAAGGPRGRAAHAGAPGRLPGHHVPAAAARAAPRAGRRRLAAPVGVLHTAPQHRVTCGELRCRYASP